MSNSKYFTHRDLALHKDLPGVKVDGNGCYIDLTSPIDPSEGKRKSKRGKKSWGDCKVKARRGMMEEMMEDLAQEREAAKKEKRQAQSRKSSNKHNANRRAAAEALKAAEAAKAAKASEGDTEDSWESRTNKLEKLMSMKVESDGENWKNQHAQNKATTKEVRQINASLGKHKAETDRQFRAQGVWNAEVDEQLALQDKVNAEINRKITVEAKESKRRHTLAVTGNNRLRADVMTDRGAVGSAEKTLRVLPNVFVVGDARCLDLLPDLDYRSTLISFFEDSLERLDGNPNLRLFIFITSEPLDEDLHADLILKYGEVGFPVLNIVECEVEPISYICRINEEGGRAGKPSPREFGIKTCATFQNEGLEWERHQDLLSYLKKEDADGEATHDGEKILPLATPSELEVRGCVKTTYELEHGGRVHSVDIEAHFMDNARTVAMRYVDSDRALQLGDKEKTIGEIYALIHNAQSDFLGELRVMYEGTVVSELDLENRTIDESDKVPVCKLLNQERKRRESVCAGSIVEEKSFFDAHLQKVSEANVDEVEHVSECIEAMKVYKVYPKYDGHYFPAPRDGRGWFSLGSSTQRDVKNDIYSIHSYGKADGVF